MSVDFYIGCFVGIILSVLVIGAVAILVARK